MKRDMEQFMEDRFQIKPDQGATGHPVHILDILDMMITPDVDASIAVNSIRENEIACRQDVEDHSSSLFSCPHPSLSLWGTRCFFVSTSKVYRPEAVATCQSMGANLVTIRNDDEDDALHIASQQRTTWIGLEKKSGTWTWPDGTTLTDANYKNWRADQPPPGGSCVVKKGTDGGWRVPPNCEGGGDPRIIACSMEADRSEQSWNSTDMKMLKQRTCTNPGEEDVASRLPAIDVFLNPAKELAKKKLIKDKKNVAKKYFRDSNMQTLYPELFRILWESTLPCFKEENNEEHMLLSCELAGVELSCEDYFTRIPTDRGMTVIPGMCCALNVESSLRSSENNSLIKELQGDKETKEVLSQEGIRSGLKLTLDLHSNTVSFGTMFPQYSAFSLFVGHSSQFPTIRDKSIQLEAGKEHFVDLSATVVTTKSIREILPEARGCLFTDESDLEFYKSYTYSNCRLECQIKLAEQKHKCIPWHLPKVGQNYEIHLIPHLSHINFHNCHECNKWFKKCIEIHFEQQVKEINVFRKGECYQSKFVSISNE